MAVMNPSRFHFIAANKSVLNINLNLILITEMIEAILDGFILLSAVKLLWNRYYAGSNHLSFRGRKTVLRPKVVQRLKKFFALSYRSELKSEKADGFGIRHSIVKTQSQNRQKRNTTLDLKLQLMVRPVVAGIQHHDLEPESNTKRFSAGIGLPLLVSNGRQSLAKLPPVDYLVKFNSRVAAVVELFKNRLPVKKSCWLQDLSLDDKLNHPNLIVNGLILTDGQKIA